VLEFYAPRRADPRSASDRADETVAFVARRTGVPLGTL